MREITISEILGDCTPKTAIHASEAKPVTIWLPVEAKESYDRLQTQTRKQFGKKARELLLALIETAEARAG